MTTMNKKPTAQQRAVLQRELERRLALLSAHKKNMARVSQLIRTTSGK